MTKPQTKYSLASNFFVLHSQTGDRSQQSLKIRLICAMPASFQVETSATDWGHQSQSKRQVTKPKDLARDPGHLFNTQAPRLLPDSASSYSPGLVLSLRLLPANTLRSKAVYVRDKREHLQCSLSTGPSSQLSAEEFRNLSVATFISRYIY